jgi:hypothetical protein
MEVQQIIKGLQQHKEWRRGLGKYEEAGTMPHTPKELGVIIEASIQQLTAAAERERILREALQRIVRHTCSDTNQTVVFIACKALAATETQP